MLAGMRSRFLLSFLLAFVVTACLPAQSQVNGVPASVTSLGFGGHFTPGVRASVTSLGPNGFGNRWPVFGNCCANFFMPSNPNPPLFSGRHHRRHGDQGFSPVGIIEPAYVPYPVPYVVDANADNEDDAPDADYLRATSQRRPAAPRKRTEDFDPAPSGSDLKADPSSKPTPAVEEKPVIAQPSTVLIFKNGNQSEVVNYAIVGDTLFDFGDGRTKKILLADLDLPATQKANDNRGVEFQVPGNLKRQ
jgi:hypothetical protein